MERENWKPRKIMGDWRKNDRHKVTQETSFLIAWSPELNLEVEAREQSLYPSGLHSCWSSFGKKRGWGPTQLLHHYLWQALDNNSSSLFCFLKEPQWRPEGIPSNISGNKAGLKPMWTMAFHLGVVALQQLGANALLGWDPWGYRRVGEGLPDAKNGCWTGSKLRPDNGAIFSIRKVHRGGNGTPQCFCTPKEPHLGRALAPKSPQCHDCFGAAGRHFWGHSP